MNARDVRPAYSPRNPKIDLLDAAGFYIASTNHFPTCRDALAWYATRPINGRNVARAARARK